MSKYTEVNDIGPISDLWRLSHGHLPSHKDRYARRVRAEVNRVLDGLEYEFRSAAEYYVVTITLSGVLHLVTDDRPVKKNRDTLSAALYQISESLDLGWYGRRPQ